MSRLLVGVVTRSISEIDEESNVDRRTCLRLAGAGVAAIVGAGVPAEATPSNGTTPPGRGYGVGRYGDAE